MWFEKFLSAIDSGWIGDAVERRLELIKKTDPQNIYVENIRSFFRVPFRVAKFFCEVAVREGVFQKRVGYLCPNDKNIIKYMEPGAEATEIIICYVCEAEGREECEFDPRSLQAIEVYSVVKVGDHDLVEAS